jgi:hypothetical protein
MIRKHFRIRRIVLGLAFAAIAAPAAQAYSGYTVDGPTPGIQSKTDARHQALLDRHAALGQLPITTPQRKIASEISVQSTLTPLQVEGMRWQAMADLYARQNPVRSENSFGAPGPGAGGAQGPTGVEVVASTSSRFDWSDAGIGASVVFGAALMLLLAAAALGRRNRPLATV